MTVRSLCVTDCQKKYQLSYSASIVELSLICNMPTRPFTGDIRSAYLCECVRVWRGREHREIRTMRKHIRYVHCLFTCILLYKGLLFSSNGILKMDKSKSIVCYNVCSVHLVVLCNNLYAISVQNITWER